MADLNSSCAGRAAETKAAAVFLRAGFSIGLPCWDDDECDLLLFHQDGNDLITLPVQVKSAQGGSAAKPELEVKNLKKRYIDENRWLSLFLIAHSTDCMWFIPGKENIIAAYDKWVAAGKTTGKGRKRTKYADLKPNANVPFRISTGHGQSIDPNDGWAIDPDKASVLTKNIIDLVRLVKASRA